jgi:hypothetical protein
MSELDVALGRLVGDQSEIDSGERSFLVADVSLGVGAAALAAATTVYLTRPTLRAAPSASRSASGQAVRLGVAF